jgi:plastocyanin
MTLLVVTLMACGGTSEGVTEIRMQDNTFTPDGIEIAVGQEITFVNRGRVDHNVIATDGSFDSREPRGVNQEPGDSWSVTIGSPGSYGYYCSLHAVQSGDGEWQGMVGTLIVEASETGE